MSINDRKQNSKNKYSIKVALCIKRKINKFFDLYFFLLYGIYCVPVMTVLDGDVVGMEAEEVDISTRTSPLPVLRTEAFSTSAEDSSIESSVWSASLSNFKCSVKY